MSTVVLSTFVAAPLKHVIEVITDIEQAAERLPGMTSLEVLSKGPFGEGTRWRETRLMFKKEAVEEMCVTGFQPPHNYSVEANSHGMIYSSLFEFLPEALGTRVSWTSDGRPQSPGAKLTAPILALLFNGTMKRCMQCDLDAL